jgi:predicted TPR repeat methyltransferase
MTTNKTAKQTFDEAFAHHKAGRYAEAVDLYHDVLELEPNHADANNLLGLLALENGHVEPALELFQTAIAAVPDSAMFLSNYADALAAANRPLEAVTMYRMSLALDRDRIAPHYNLGLLFQRLDNKADAHKCFRETLRIDPDHPGAKHLAVAMSGGRAPSTAPAGYVSDLFDGYAVEFDEHLKGTLQYTVPEELFAHVSASVSRDSGSVGWTVVDLGCGTGLCGELFRPLANTLVGCDLSSGMLNKAAAKEIYDELHQEDLVTTLGRYDADIDLAIAADVFIYVGDLQPTFVALATALRTGGRLAFSIEDAQSGTFVLRDTGRYAHSKRWVNHVATEAGLTMEWTRAVTIRKEGDEEIRGHLIVARK